MVVITKFILVIIVGMLLLCALIVAVANHWTACALVVIAAGLVATVGRALTRRQARTRYERLADEYVNAWPGYVPVASWPDDDPEDRQRARILAGDQDEQGHT